MALTDPHAPGATPLQPADIQGLRHKGVSTHGELNELEARNMVLGQEWALISWQTRLPGMLSDKYLRLLHSKMYGGVWTWAGDYRQHDTNIGVAHATIRPELHLLFDDACFWLDHDTYPPREFAVRIHHRLVKVQPFANGNGRHARLFVDLVLIRHFGLPRLPWGGGDLGSDDPRRAEYIAALHAADNNDYGALLAFSL